MKLSREEIARVAHEVNRAYCMFIGDNTQVPWSEAPQWQKDSAIAGVENIIKNPNVSPEQMHEHWLKVKKDDGWQWGAEKSVVHKLHPCMVPYDRLPENQRVKDHLFSAVAKSLLGIPVR